MTERYAKLARQHIARTSSTARGMWNLLEPACEKANVGLTDVRLLYVRLIFYVFGYR